MSGHHRSERGATLLEIAIVAPIVFLSVFAVFEFGLVFRDQLTTQDAVADAARVGAIVGPDVVGSPPHNGDFEILSTLRQGMASIPAEWIDTIVVFRAGPAGAGDPEDQVPSACRSGIALVGRCNIYDAVEAFAHVQAGDTAWFDCSSTPGSPACSWEPTTRNEGPNPSVIDYIGVWVRVDRDALTGIGRDHWRIDRAAIVRLEPGAT